MSRTEIATLGEFGLIDHLTGDIQLTQATSVKGIGDDAAILHNPDKRTLVTTDLLLEGIHFDLIYVPLKHLGYKAAVVNFSDIYAMNGRPQQITVSLGISKRFSVEDLDAFYDGVKLACEIYGVDIVGGDTTSSLTGFTISITCIGIADEEQIVCRNGAKDTYLIYVPTWGFSCWKERKPPSTDPAIFNPTSRGGNTCWNGNSSRKRGKISCKHSGREVLSLPR